MSKDTLEIEVRVAKADKNVKKLTKSLDKLEKEGRQVDKTMKKTSKGMGVMGKVMAGLGGIAIGGLLLGAFKKTIAATIKQENAIKQMESRLNSTGGAVGLLSSELQEYASALQDATVHGDEAILEMQSILLTFTQVTGEEFKGATEAILNISTVMGTDMKSAAIQVGKALNDPIKGLDGLSRSGIQFSQSQKDVIKDLAETGRVAEAQQMVLKELENQFGGAATAARDTLGGALAALSNTWGDLFEAPKKDTEEFKKAIQDLEQVLKSNEMKAAMNDIRLSALGLAEGFAKFVLAANMYMDLAKLIGVATSDTADKQDASAQAAARQTDGFSSVNAQLEAGHPLLTQLREDFYNAREEMRDQRRELVGLQQSYMDALAGGVDPMSAGMVILRGELTSTTIALSAARAEMRGLRLEKQAFGAGGVLSQGFAESLIDVPTIESTRPTLPVIESAVTLGGGGGGGGGGGKSDAEKEAEATEKAFISLYESLNPLVKLSREYAADVRILNDAEAAGLATKQQIALAQATLTQEYEKSKEELLELTDATVDWAEITESAISDFASGMADTLVDGILEGEMAFEDFAKSFLANIAKMILEAQILAAINMILGVKGTAATGAVVAGGKMTPFAAGGIVSSPTVFPMANGIGLMGEAGPEAIMPLQRDRHGRLGVSGGGNTNITVINNTSADVKTEESQDQNGDSNIQFMIEQAMEEGFASGRMDKTMTQFGANRVPQ